MTTGWRWAIAGAVALVVVDVVAAVALNRAGGTWWSKREAGPEAGWPPRKRSAAILLIGLNLLIGLVAVGRLLDASAAITAVTGALGAAALTQWNQRSVADGEAADRQRERDEAARQRTEDREAEAQRRSEDRAEAAAVREEQRLEARFEWVRGHRFAAYEAMLLAQREYLEILLKITIGNDDPEPKYDPLEVRGAVSRRLMAVASVEVWGSPESAEAARRCLSVDSALDTKGMTRRESINRRRELGNAELKELVARFSAETAGLLRPGGPLGQRVSVGVGEPAHDGHL